MPEQPNKALHLTPPPPLPQLCRVAVQAVSQVSFAVRPLRETLHMGKAQEGKSLGKVILSDMTWKQFWAQGAVMLLKTAAYFAVLITIVRWYDVLTLHWFPQFFSSWACNPVFFILLALPTGWHIGELVKVIRQARRREVITRQIGGRGPRKGAA